MIRVPRPTAVTLALLAAATTAVVLVRHDPWRGGPAAVPLVSTQSAARRVFPGLGEADLARATIELRTPERATRLVPGADGRHRVLTGDDELLGEADGEALDGLWSSLRMATTLRAVAAGSDLGGETGRIVVTLDAAAATLEIHGAAADGTGLLGALDGGEAWVVEPELAELLRQAPEAWVARRLLPLEPAAVASFVWDGLTVARGEDGLWRVADGGPRLLLASAAVDLRLDRALAAGLGPLLPRAQAAGLGPFTRRLAVTDLAGHVHEVLSGGPCPTRQDHVVVDRGEGLLGCVDADAFAAWRPDDPDAGLVENQLVPYAYGRVLAVDQQAPAARRLRRFGGGWVLEEAGAMVEVAEPEVFRWYGALQATTAELFAPGAAPASFEPQHRLTIETDSGQHLRLACGPVGDGLACARDDGPPLRVSGGPPELAFSRDTFADRRLLQFGAGEVRGLEILPGSKAAAAVRQSVRLDLGVWRLDAPAHPDGVGVLDEVRLEALLAALGSARAEAWVPAPGGGPRRSLRVERAPTGSAADDALVLELYDGCVARVPGQRQAARIADQACAALADDLLYDDPLRFWLGQARRVEITDLRTAVPRHATLTPGDGGGLVLESGEASLAAHVAAWVRFRSAGLRGGEPTGAAILTVKILRQNAAAVNVLIGPGTDLVPGWIRLSGADWHYLAGSPADDPG